MTSLLLRPSIQRGSAYLSVSHSLTCFSIPTVSACSTHLVLSAKPLLPCPVYDAPVVIYTIYIFFQIASQLRCVTIEHVRKSGLDGIAQRRR